MGRVIKQVICFLVVCILFGQAVLSLDALTSYVNDEADVISPEDESLLNSLLDDLKKNTSVEMAVATISSLGGIPIEEYSLNLAHEFLGDEKKDNGLLLLLALDDREYRIEVGYGLEPIINAPLAGRIGRQVMEPYFKSGDYSKGLVQGTTAIVDILKNDSSWETEFSAYDYKYDYEAENTIITEFIIVFLLIMMLFAFLKFTSAKNKAGVAGMKNKDDSDDFLAAIIAASLFGKNGRGGGGSFGGGGFSGGSFGGGGGFGGGGFSGKF